MKHVGKVLWGNTNETKLNISGAEGKKKELYHYYVEQYDKSIAQKTIIHFLLILKHHLNSFMNCNILYNTHLYDCSVHTNS